MPNLISLHRLQQTDKRLEEVSEELQSLDFSNNGSALQEEETRLVSLREQKHQEERLLKDAELELAGVESEKKTVREKLFSGKITNAKELSQLEKEIGQLDKRREKLDDKVLRCMDRVAQMEKEVRDKETLFSGNRTELEAENQKKTDRRTILTQQAVELREKRENFAKSLDLELLELYEKLREKKNGLGIVKIQRNSCGGCYMSVPESTIQKVKALELVFCSSCGRILYFDKEL